MSRADLRLSHAEIEKIWAVEGIEITADDWALLDRLKLDGLSSEERIAKIKAEFAGRALNSNRQAFSEGWGLFDVEGVLRIQRLDDPKSVTEGNEHMIVPGVDYPDEPVFDGDGDALSYVTGRANEGSEYHKHALALHLTITKAARVREGEQGP